MLIHNERVQRQETEKSVLVVVVRVEFGHGASTPDNNKSATTRSSRDLHNGNLIGLQMGTRCLYFDFLIG